MVLGLTQAREVEQNVKTEQDERGTTPDHQAAFPGEGLSEFALASPGNQEGWIVRAFHQYNLRVRVEGAEGIWHRRSGLRAD